VPAEVHANRMQWFIRLCIICGYVSVMWRAGIWLRCQVHTNAVVTICTPDDRHVGARNMLSQQTSYTASSGWFFTSHNVYDAQSHEHKV
jgi:hypothetical protein